MPPFHMASSRRRPEWHIGAGNVPPEIRQTVNDCCDAIESFDWENAQIINLDREHLVVIYDSYRYLVYKVGCQNTLDRWFKDHEPSWKVGETLGARNLKAAALGPLPRRGRGCGSWQVTAFNINDLTQCSLCIMRYRLELTGISDANGAPAFVDSDKASTIQDALADIERYGAADHGKTEKEACVGLFLAWHTLFLIACKHERGDLVVLYRTMKIQEVASGLIGVQDLRQMLEEYLWPMTYQAEDYKEWAGHFDNAASRHSSISYAQAVASAPSLTTPPVPSVSPTTNQSGYFPTSSGGAPTYAEDGVSGASDSHMSIQRQPVTTYAQVLQAEPPVTGVHGHDFAVLCKAIDLEFDLSASIQRSNTEKKPSAVAAGKLAISSQSAWFWPDKPDA